MSLLDPTDFADTLPGVPTDRVQAAIDQAESEVASLLGMLPHMTVVGGSDRVLVEGDDGSVTSAGTGPLSQFEAAHLARPKLDAKVIEVDPGPMSQLRRVTVNGEVQSRPSDTFHFSPWLVRLLDPDQVFRSGVPVLVEYLVGWASKDDLPSSIRRAVEYKTVAIAQDALRVGGEGQVKSFAIGPYRQENFKSSDATGRTVDEQVLDLTAGWRRAEGVG